MKWGDTALFVCAAVPALVAAVGLWLLGRLKAPALPSAEVLAAASSQ
jgi:hypothetical protein